MFRSETFCRNFSRLQTGRTYSRKMRLPAFGACGGCVWQDLDYLAQLDYKAAQVRESLEHLGGLSGFELRGIVGMASPWRYRNRADFSIGMTDEGDK